MVERGRRDRKWKRKEKDAKKKKKYLYGGVGCEGGCGGDGGLFGVMVVVSGLW